MAENFIQDAIKRPGALTRSADRAGETTAEYAREHQHDPGRKGKQARLAMKLRKLSKRKGKRSKSHR